MNKIIQFIFIQLLIPIGLMGQVSQSTSLGNFRKVTVDKQIYTFTTNRGIARVTVYTPDIIRITVVKQNFSKTFSYAVVENPVKCNIKTSENKESYTIQTDSMRLKIQKDPLRFTFYNSKGQMVNSDDPAFGTSWMGDEVSTYKTLQEGERFIGLGEQTGNLDRRGDARVNYNSDNPGYSGRAQSLYSSIPFYMGLHHHLCYGIFFDNSARTTFSFGAGNNRFSSFRADCGEMDYYFIYRSSVKGIINSYTWLTGRMPMPPIWSLGYQQCRYSYFPEADVLSIAKTFRQRHIPADMIYLDIHFMDHFKLFTWDKERFPHPAQMISDLGKLSFHTAVIIDPGVKVEKDYPVYESGIKSDVFVKYPDGTRYEGDVWPGWCNFPDFTMARTREWWGNWVKTYADEGVTGFWNDMNEIAAWGKDVPDLLEFNWEGKKTTYREAKNVYGFLMARSSYEGAKKNMNGKRPFVLTRAGYSGLQRYSAIWTGDNKSSDNNMMLGVRLLNSMGLSGLSFTGMDVGGFMGNPAPNLYARWMQIGTFFPMFRQHTALYTMHAEPWAFGEMIEDIARRYIGFRYQLMPYLYSNFYESTQDGMPVMRSLAFNYTFDKNIYDPRFQQQFLFGPSILVAPVKGYDGLAEVYLPHGKWYDLFTDKPLNGDQITMSEVPLNKIPLYVKAGSIIPMQKLVESTAENPGDTLFVHLYAGNQPNKYVYYEDDGTTFDYTKGAFYKRTIRYIPEKNEMTFDGKEGSYESKFKVISLIFHGFTPDELNKLKVDGQPVKTVSDKLRFFTSHFIFADYGPNDTKNVLKASFENADHKIDINW